MSRGDAGHMRARRLPVAPFGRAHPESGLRPFRVCLQDGGARFRRTVHRNRLDGVLALRPRLVAVPVAAHAEEIIIIQK